MTNEQSFVCVLQSTRYVVLKANLKMSAGVALRNVWPNIRPSLRIENERIKITP